MPWRGACSASWTDTARRGHDEPMIAFASRYAALPEHFFARLAPAPGAAPRLIQFNEALARHLGLNTAALDAAQLAQV